MADSPVSIYWYLRYLGNAICAISLVLFLALLALIVYLNDIGHVYIHIVSSHGNVLFLSNILRERAISYSVLCY